MADETKTPPPSGIDGTGTAGQDPASLEAAKTAYQALFDALGEAYWAASTVQGKDQIQGVRDAVHDVLTGIIQAQLEEDTKQLDSLTSLVSTTNDALDKLQASIDGIVQKITVVTQVEDAIANVLQMAGKFL
jgi:hypothetical protein